METIPFKLVGDYVELNQLLKLTGVCDSGGADVPPLLSSKSY